MDSALTWRGGLRACVILGTLQIGSTQQSLRLAYAVLGRANL